MGESLIPKASRANLPSRERARERVKKILVDGTAKNTIRAYEGDVRYFWAWADAVYEMEEQYPVPVDLVVEFVTDHLYGLDEESDRMLVEAGHKAKEGPHAITTIRRRLSSLSMKHQSMKLASPTLEPEVKLLMSKARKAVAKQGWRPRKKKAAVGDILKKMLATCGESLMDKRDAALLLCAWASGGRRRSEVSTMVMENLEPDGSDFKYLLGITKTDQEGRGSYVPIAGDAAFALRRWLDAAKIVKGPIFRGLTKHGTVKAEAMNDKTVERVVKKRAEMAGLDPKLFAGHSLRSGFITEGGRKKMNLLDLMAMSQHKTVQVAQGYYQSGEALNNPAARMSEGLMGDE